MSSYDYPALNKMFSKHKAALTRAQNSGDPQKVVDTVNKHYGEWDDKIDAGVMPAYPDNWHRWERARDDAQFQLHNQSLFNDRR